MLFPPFLNKELLLAPKSAGRQCYVHTTFFTSMAFTDALSGWKGGKPARKQ